MSDLRRQGSSSSYADFLAAKAEHRWQHGPDVDVEDLHPILHPWQHDVTAWAIRTGRAAVFADCGLGKTFVQLEWARHVAPRTLILAPLSVARQTVREARTLGLEVTYVRSAEELPDVGVAITNYEMADKVGADWCGAVVLDESSILKAVDGKTRRRLTDLYASVPYRLACSATPAPNDVAELTNHAEFLGVMPRNEMLAAYFVHDSDTGWRLKGHAAEAMYDWMATWAVALRKPSDLGYDDAAYLLPPMKVVSEVVRVEVVPDGQLFATDLGGVGGRAAVRRETLTARVARSVELAKDHGDEQIIVWCGLNDEADGVAKALGGEAVNVPGSWKPEDKAAALEAFQDGTTRVLVTKVQIAGFGMNFQNCARQIFCGIGDSYESYYQAIRRSWRYGQQRPVTAHVVVSDLEQQIVQNVRRKELEADRMNGQLVRAVARRIEMERAA